MGVLTKIPRGGKPVLLDTLAQLAEYAPSKAGGGAVNQKNSGKNSLQTVLSKRAKSKYITDAIAYRLADLKSPLHDSYRRTVFCSGFMLQEGKTMTSKYCNGRWCLTCNRIRTAKLMNGYLPQIEKFENKQFVTLTVPNCSEAELYSTMREMYHNMRRVRKKLSNWGINAKAVRKLECTYNEDTDQYHPHFHIIINGEGAARFMVYWWLQYFPDASYKAQDIRKADVSSIKELFKYSTKLVVKSKKDKGNVILAKPLDIIFTAMKGLRTFQKMGDIKKITEDVEEIEAQVYSELETQAPGDPLVKIWRWMGKDWCHIETGELLTGHEPTLNAYSVVHNKDDTPDLLFVPVIDKRKPDWERPIITNSSFFTNDFV